MAERTEHLAVLADVGSADGALPAMSPTNDDETIARLLQSEFDEEFQLAQQLQKRASITSDSVVEDAGRRATPVDRLQYPVQSSYDRNSSASSSPTSSTTSASLPPFLSDAKTAVKNTIAEIVGLIKQETSRAGQPSPSSSRNRTSQISRETDENDRDPSLSQAPLDFTKFLDDMRDRRAYPLTKYFRSFLREFTKRSWTVSEQQKIVHDFTDFMAQKVSENEVWANASEEELDNAREGMEKLLMNKLHQFTFSPSTSDDSVKDEVLHKKISILRWLKLEHLDVTISQQVSDSFIKVARQELLKINDYKAPHDKLICILNCCKVIFGLLKQTGTQTNADMFLPLLIFIVIQANPPHLISNVQYISRFRNTQKLQSESGYYLTNLMGAISFIESLDVKSLSITPEEFDRQIEQTMKELEQEAIYLEEQSVAQTSIEQFRLTPQIQQPSPLISQERLQVFATKAKKPLDMIGRWFSEVQLPIRNDVVVSPSQTQAPTSHGLPIDDSGTNTQLSALDNSSTTPIDQYDHSPILTENERTLIEDYELQMAMAMSISLESEKLKWKTNSNVELQGSQEGDANFQEFNLEDAAQGLAQHKDVVQKTESPSDVASTLPPRP